MPVNRDSRNRDLDQMSTESLEQILRQDAEAPAEQESDIEFLLDVMEVLAKRKKETGQDGKTAEKAWESFQEEYLPKPEAEGAKTGKRIPLWLRRMLVSAAAAALILCLPMTARAFDWDKLWDVVARWAKETFSFVSERGEQVGEPSPTYDGEYSSLQDLLKKNNRPFDMIPTWIPEGYVLKNIEKDITPTQEIYSAFYSNKESKITLRVQTYISQKNQNVEIEDESMEKYTVSGIDYYIFSNLDQCQAVWIENSYECIIYGNLSVGDLKTMIDSIKRG